MAKKSKKVPAKLAEKVFAAPREPVEIPVQYIKAQLFRVVHADGVIGGILPSGRGMNIAFYSERMPFAQTEIFELGANGEMIEPTQTQRKPGIYREIEVSTSLDYETAHSLMDWLNKVVPVLKNIQNKNGSGSEDPGNNNSTNHAQVSHIPADVAGSASGTQGTAAPTSSKRKRRAHYVHS